MKILIHIGLHKTATTWMQQQYFRQHSKIHLVSNSARPWEDPFISYLIRTRDGHFDAEHAKGLLAQCVSSCDVEGGKVCVVSAERLSGHPASGGIDGFRTANRLFSVAPDARIFCVVRDQVSMIESIYRQLVAERFVGSVDELLHCNSWKIPGFDPGFWEYDLLIGEYQKPFHEENVYVAHYEEFRADKTSFLKSLCGFVGIPYEVPAEEDKIANRSLSITGVYLLRMLNRMRQSEYNPHPILKLPGFVSSSAIRLLKKVGRQGEVLTDEDKKNIRRYYRDSNERLNWIAKTIKSQ